MPPLRTKRTSTQRRLELAEVIDTFGDTMVKKCSTCAKHNRVCKVHVRSGRCNECTRRNQRCDVKVTQNEFRRLIDEKQKLRRNIDEALSAQADALEALRTARAREERLRQQMDLIDKRAEEAISVESRAVEEQEMGETLDTSGVDTTGLALQLSPDTWGCLNDVPAGFWENPLDPQLLQQLDFTVDGVVDENPQLASSS
ncbi:hypothetical protein KC333_g9370 [Hortaea werneckii]|nr:hypothetical protein KC365_g17583 [Hortaea werneckii]KAI7207718.1 hypothetical protein KC333_g9370 [Hortaea werneckii]KAI7300160.1 hypothetical protein KC326_g9376 [Hortaea werneckii]KAI7537760.1 hypothetical protein KC331_g10749 [Hortaea werneckii]KAI7709606.1 hypothetical protein KC353_g10259 [Hortaea werneckii]